MSVHPNVLALVHFTPDDLARRTFRAMLAELGVADAVDPTVRIGNATYDFHLIVMEDEDDEELQVAAKEGEIVAWCCVTYGYYESIAWADLVQLIGVVDEWAKGLSGRVNCTYRISISANYW